VRFASQGTKGWMSDWRQGYAGLEGPLSHWCQVGLTPSPLPAVASVPAGLNTSSLTQPGQAWMHFQKLLLFLLLATVKEGNG